MNQSLSNWRSGYWDHFFLPNINLSSSRKKKERKRNKTIEDFDPFPPHGRQTVTNYQNEFLELYDVLEGEGNGRHFTRWVKKTLHQKSWPNLETQSIQLFTLGISLQPFFRTSKTGGKLCFTHEKEVRMDKHLCRSRKMFEWAWECSAKPGEHLAS